MASGNRRGRDWVLGGRHLVGVFVLLVVLFGVVFTLGYLLGRNQYDAQVRASASTVPGSEIVTNKPAVKPGRTSADREPAAPPSDWDFYHSAEPAKPAQPMPEPPKSIVPSRPPAASPAKPAPIVESSRSNTAPPNAIRSVNAPAIPRGATVLQVAAMARQSDAVRLAQALQRKRFPAFVAPRGNDRYYRVQVGPYTDAQAADLARQKLASQGFKAIARR
jgi:cell division septation protein DedD